MYKKNSQLVLKKIEEKFYVILDSNVFEINESTARILSLCKGDQSSSFENILEKISIYYSISAVEIEDDIKRVLDELLEVKIIEFNILL